MDRVDAVAATGSDVMLTAADLAGAAGTTTERIAILASAGVVRPTDEGRYATGDVHRVRLLEAFESAGVPLDALLAAAASGRIDFGGYHELHRDPGAPSSRTFGAFRADVDPGGAIVSGLFTAFGLAEPGADARLAADEEAFVSRWIDLVGAIDDPSLAVRVVRLFAEAARRASDAALDVYAEAASRLGPDPASVDPEAYAELLEPWARLARELPSLAAWLTERHLRRSIDAFSVETTEQLLAAGGYVPARTVALPGIAFVDLTGFTRTTQELGDEAAAGLALRLGELARTVAEGYGGRLVKLLGDGALLQLPDAQAAVAATAELLVALVPAGLPSGHAGIHRGPVIEREGDVFGRSVNLAARISDRAPDGALYVTAEVVADMASTGIAFTPVGTSELQGSGAVELFAVDLTTVARRSQVN